MKVIDDPLLDLIRKLPKGEFEQKTLGGRIKTAMALRGMKYQTTLAQQIGVPKQTIGKWISNEPANITFEYLYKAADALRISARWLSTGEGPPSKGIRLDPDKAALMGIYDRLDPDDRDSWMSLGRKLAAGKGGPDDPFKLPPPRK